MIRSLKNTTRLLGIALILGKVQLQHSHKRKGQRLALAFERLGPAFIKLGQSLSTRSDLIGDELADDLSGLRDRIPPFPTSTARAIIESELKAPIASLFSSFNDTPIAAASIAQVHKATTKNGDEVAVKILRPDIEKAFARDVDLFFWIAEIMEHNFTSTRRLKPLEVVKTLKESVFFELDLRFEAAAADELAANIAKHEPGFRVPKIHWPLTSQRVMSAQWIDGIPMSDIETIRASRFDTTMLLSKAARSLFSQVFVDGFFHADLHPGNLFIDKNGDIVAVDFGIMGRLDWNSRMYMAEILRGFLTEDYRHVAQMHFDAGYVPAGKSLEAFTQACRAVARPIMGKPVNEISVAELLGQMFKIAAEFEMETQPQLLLLQKTMMVTEGVGRMLDPKLNMWDLARPLIEEWAAQHFGLKAKIKDSAMQGFDIAKKFPIMLGKIENTLVMLGDKDGLKLHPQTLDSIKSDRRINQKSWLLLGWSGLFLIAVFLVLYAFH